MIIKIENICFITYLFLLQESGCFSSMWHIFIHFDSEDAMRNMRLNYKSLCAIIASPDDTQ